ncbi:hypothetical protein ACFQ4O_13140, partial [Methylopila musalis]
LTPPLTDIAAFGERLDIIRGQGRAADVALAAPDAVRREAGQMMQHIEAQNWDGASAAFQRCEGHLKALAAIAGRR